MPSSPRPTFKAFQDWTNYIGKALASPGGLQGDELIALRQQCYKEIEAIRGRPLLVYATRFLGALPGSPVSIDITDVDGFTDLVNSIPAGTKEIDVLIHSPGGSPDATERLVHVLRGRFEEVHFLIPHSAYSAATMLALSGNSVTLHPSATLGPIDPQINGIPARSTKRGFDNVREAIRTGGPEVLPAYMPLIEKCSLELLEMCEDAENLSQELVSKWMLTYMLKGNAAYETQVKDAVKFFSHYDTHLTHSRPLTIDKFDEFKLPIHQADNGLSDLLWEAYIMISGFFGLTNFVKLYESTTGISWGKQYQPTPNSPSQSQATSVLA